MGLTIHYSLKARGNETRARKLIAALHQTAQDLPFKELGPIVDLFGDACDFNKRDRDDPLRWLLVQAEESVGLPCSGGGTRSFRVKPDRIIAFTAWPGEGCEESNFGLCQFPKKITHPEFGVMPTRLSGWSWGSFCKTNYASNPNCGGWANFVRCHLTVIALLDKAKELGCLEAVRDEGGFWQQRDVAKLADEIGSWNQMLAAFGGQLKDVLGDEVQAAISEYPNFEQLEAAGQNQLPPEVAILAKLIRQVLKQPAVTP